MSMVRTIFRTLALVACLLAAVPPAFAQSPNTDTYFYTPGGGGVNGALGMCLNTSNKAVPCSAAGVQPSPVTFPPYPVNTTTNVAAAPITASSGNVAAATATATLAGVAGKTTYSSGFEFTFAGATAASVVTCTLTGTISGTMSYTVAVPAGAAVGGTPLVVTFNPAIPANAANTAIVASCPSLGTGNTNATMTAHGYQL